MLKRHAAAVAAGLLAIASSAQAGVIYSTNFTTGTLGSTTTSSSTAVAITTTSITGWTGAAGYFVYSASPSATAMQTAGYVAPPAGAGGGNALGIKIPTTIGATSLSAPSFSVVAGNSYVISFEQALANASGLTAATSGDWSVLINGSSIGTTPVMNVTTTFSGWSLVTETFVAGATGTDTLAFVNGNAIASNAPMLLIADVTVTRVPEPASIALFGAGVLGLLAIRRRRAA